MMGGGDGGRGGCFTLLAPSTSSFFSFSSLVVRRLFLSPTVHWVHTVHTLVLFFLVGQIVACVGGANRAILVAAAAARLGFSSPLLHAHTLPALSPCMATLTSTKLVVFWFSTNAFCHNQFSIYYAVRVWLRHGNSKLVRSSSGHVASTVTRSSARWGMMMMQATWRRL